MITDAHSHLQNLLPFTDLEPIFDRMSRSDVMCAVNCSASVDDWAIVEKLADPTQFKGALLKIIPAFGIHPWYVTETLRKTPDWEARLENILRKHPEAFIGETGLDAYHEPRNDVLQEEFFKTHLRLGKRLGRPIVIHCVRAWDGMLRILKGVRQSNELPPALQFHAFGGGAEIAKQLLRYNAWFSFAGTVLKEKNVRGREGLLAIPRERILLETDCPDLVGPAEYRLGLVRRKGNNKCVQSEPADLRLVLKGIAQLLGMEPATLEAQLEDNFLRFHACLSPVKSEEAQ